MTALFSSGELADLREVLLAMYRPHFRRVAANELHFQQMARDSSARSAPWSICVRLKEMSDR